MIETLHGRRQGVADLEARHQGRTVERTPKSPDDIELASCVNRPWWKKAAQRG